LENYLGELDVVEAFMKRYLKWIWRWTKIMDFTYSYKNIYKKM